MSYALRHLIIDATLEDSDNLPEPEVLAAEIVESLETALEQFKAIYEELGEKPAVIPS